MRSTSTAVLLAALLLYAPSLGASQITCPSSSVGPANITCYAGPSNNGSPTGAAVVTGALATVPWCECNCTMQETVADSVFMINNYYGFPVTGPLSCTAAMCTNVSGSTTPYSGVCPATGVNGYVGNQGAAVGTSIVATTVAYSAIVGTPYFPSPAQNAGPWSGWAPTAGVNCIFYAISCTSALASSGNASTFFCFPSTVGSTFTLYSVSNAANCQSQSALFSSLLGTAVTGYQCNTSNCNGPPANPTPASAPTSTSSATLVKPAAGLVATAIVAMFI